MILSVIGDAGYAMHRPGRGGPDGHWVMDFNGPQRLALPAIVISGWCGHFLPIDGMPAMIMGAGNYKIGEFWKFTIPQYFIRLLALTIGAVLIFPMR